MRTLYFVFGIFFSASLMAQVDSTLEDKSIIAESQFRASLSSSNRLEVKAKLPAIDTATQPLNYQVIDKEVDIDFETPRFPVLSIKKDPLPEVYNGFLRAGYGTPKFWLGEGSYYQNFMDDALRLGVEGNYMSADNTENVDHQKVSALGLGLNGTYYLQEGMTLDANVRYGLDKVKYYGIAEGDSFQGRNFDQDFNRFQTGIKFYNGELTGGDLNYSAALQFNSVKDNYATKEVQYKGELGLGKYINEQHLLDIKAGGEITRYEDTTVQKLDNYFVKPTFTFHADRFYVKGGLNIVFHDNKTSYIPEVEVLASILGEQITAFAGYTGGVQQNNFNQLTATNPFLFSRQQINNSVYRDLYGGFKGTYKKADYQIKVGYKWVDNLALFEHRPQDYRMFIATYDTAQILYFTATADVKLFDKLDLIFALHQNNFSLDREDKAWYLPTFELNTTAIYKMLNDKLDLRGELYFANNINFRTVDGRAEKTNTLLDLNLQANYWIVENIGAFVNLNNLANNKFQRWNNYPTFGFNVQAGVKARF